MGSDSHSIDLRCGCVATGVGAYGWKCASDCTEGHPTECSDYCSDCVRKWLIPDPNREEVFVWDRLWRSFT